MLLSQFVLPSPSLIVSTCLFSTYMSPFLPYKQVHQYHFSGFHIYAFLYKACFSFSDLLRANKPLESRRTLCDPMDCSPCQAPLSMGFSRQDYWSRSPCPPPGDLPNPGIKPTSLMSPMPAGMFFTTGAAGKPSWLTSLCIKRGFAVRHSWNRPAFTLLCLFDAREQCGRLINQIHALNINYTHSLKQTSWLICIPNHLLFDREVEHGLGGFFCFVF